jgi:hypothetical protein
MSLYKNLQQMDISQALNSFVDFYKNQGLLNYQTLGFSIRFSASDYENENHFLRTISFLYQGGGYTTVAYTDQNLLDVEFDKDLTEVIFEACHDSCWRDATKRIIQKVVQEAEQYFDFENNSGQIHVFNHFDLCGLKLMNIQLKGSYDTGLCKIYRAPKEDIIFTINGQTYQTDEETLNQFLNKL